MSDDTSGFVLTRYREFWGDQGANNDVLTVNGFNIISPTNSPISKRVNAMFVFDDNLDGVNNLVTPDPVLLRAAVHHLDGRLHAGGDPAERDDPPREHVARRALGDAQRAELGVEQERDLDRPACARAASDLLEPPDKDELKCEAGTSQALAKFVQAEGAVHPEVPEGQRKAGGPYHDCCAPYGGATATCIQDAKKGAEAKARSRIAKACEKACPRATRGR